MLVFILITALFCLFLHACTWEGMILERVADVTYNWPAWIRKPLFDCPICMAPWWGIVVYTIAVLSGHLQQLSTPMLVIALFAAGGLNVVLSSFISEPETERHDDTEPPGSYC